MGEGPPGGTRLSRFSRSCPDAAHWAFVTRFWKAALTTTHEPVGEDHEYHTCHRVASMEPGGMSIMRNRLYVADCVDFMARMDAETVDLTVTSPPYDNLRNYNGYSFDFEAIARGLLRVTKSAAWWCGW